MDDVLGFFPSTPFLSPSSSSSSSSSYIIGGRESGEDDSATFGAMVGRVVRIIVTCISAAVGSFIGAVTGGLIGLATESGLFRGAGIGAISGAVFTIEVVDSSLALWHSHESGIWSLLYLLDILSSLLSGRLVREKVGPAVQSAVQSQITAVNSPFMEALDIFDTGSTKGMPRESVDKLPKISITDKNNVDESGERIGCVVCLQDFQIGETVRRLPHCEHMFHLPCIDGWLLKHGSCPLCRRDF